MDEIVTKSNLDSFTQGLKGVLGSMGLEINSKAGNTAVSAVGAKVDTVDSKIDTLNTKATTIDGKCDQIVDSVGDVDFSQFVTRDYLNYMLNPKWRVFGTIYYSDESNTQRTLLYSTAEMSKVLLSYSGSTTAYCYNTGEYLSDSLWENESSSDFSVRYNNYAEIDFNENPYLILDKYYGFSFQSKYLGYVEKTESIDDSDVHYGRYPYKLNSLGASYMNAPDGIYLNRMKIIITSESNSINVNNIVITILGKNFKNGEYFYLADYYSDHGYYDNSYYSYSYFVNTNECVDTLDYSNIVVPDIEGFHYQLSINAHCICINYYIPTNTYNDVVTFNSNSSGSTNNCYKYFTYNSITRYIYYRRDPITFNSKTHFTTYVLPKSVNEIVNDIHSYVGTWDSTNNKMKLRQLDDSNNNKYSNGTNVASSNLYEFIKIPKFYVKSSNSSYTMTSSHNVTIYYDKTLQSQPEGDGWKERGGNLIGRYCTPSNSFTCGRGYTPGTRTSNSGKPSYLDTMSLIDFSTIVLLLSIRYGWTILQPSKKFFNLENLNVILDVNTNVNVPTSGNPRITSPYTIDTNLPTYSSNTTYLRSNYTGFGTIGAEVLFTPYYSTSYSSYYISNIPKYLNITHSTSQYTGGLYMDFFYGAEIHKSNTARYFRLVYNGNYTIIS